MNFSFHILPIILLSVLLLSACEEDTYISATKGTPVLQGYLHGGQAVDSIRVSLSNSYDGNDSTLQTLDNLEIEFSDGIETHLLESIGSGYYGLPSLRVEYGKTYGLSFLYEESTISASTYIPQKKEIKLSSNSIQMQQITGGGGFGGGGLANVDPIELSWDNPEGDYYFVLIQNLEEEPEYINLLLQQLLEEDEDNPRFTRITEPSITDFHSIDPRRELQQFGTHRVIVFRVNPEYAALYESSGSSSVSLAQPPTNVNNGLGIFSGLSGDTLLFEVEKL